MEKRIPTNLNVAMTGDWVTTTIPRAAKSIRFANRSNEASQYSFTSTSVYSTLKSEAVFFEDNILLKADELTLYLKAATGPIEIIYWI